MKRTESFIWMLATAVFGYAMWCLGRQAQMSNTLEDTLLGFFYYCVAGAMAGLTVMQIWDMLKRKMAR